MWSLFLVIIQCTWFTWFLLLPRKALLFVSIFLLPPVLPGPWFQQLLPHLESVFFFDLATTLVIWPRLLSEFSSCLEPASDFYGSSAPRPSIWAWPTFYLVFHCAVDHLRSGSGDGKLSSLPQFSCFHADVHAAPAGTTIQLRALMPLSGGQFSSCACCCHRKASSLELITEFAWKPVSCLTLFFLTVWAVFVLDLVFFSRFPTVLFHHQLRPVVAFPTFSTSELDLSASFLLFLWRGYYVGSQLNTSFSRYLCFRVGKPGSGSIPTTGTDRPSPYRACFCTVSWTIHLQSAFKLTKLLFSSVSSPFCITGCFVFPSSTSFSILILLLPIISAFSSRHT